MNPCLIALSTLFIGAAPVPDIESVLYSTLKSQGVVMRMDMRLILSAGAVEGRKLVYPVLIHKDADGKVDVYHCETWAQRAAEINCQSSADVKAGTGSKCNCGILAGACIPVPNTDPCKENICTLRCSNNSATVCTIGGTECTAPGFCTDTLITQNKANGSACGDQTSGACKLPDTCQSGVCTAGFKSSTTACGEAPGQCYLASSCTGTSTTCPANPPASATTACTGTSNGGLCDATDSCDGTGNCVDGFKTVTTQCRDAAGVCDLPASCTGSSGTCPPNGFRPSTYVCRAAANDCDAVEHCTGDSPDCPGDFCAGGARPAEHFCTTNAPIIARPSSK